MPCQHHNPGTRLQVTLFKRIEPGYAAVMRRLALHFGLLPGQAVSAETAPERQDQRLQLAGEKWRLTVPAGMQLELLTDRLEQSGGGGHSSCTVGIGPDGRVYLSPGTGN